MIEFQNVSKRYKTRDGWSTVLSNINFKLEKGQKLGILGRNGAGKSTFIRLVSGVEPPTSGRIQRSMSVSWPLAFSGGFQGSLTGIDNVRFICRVYDADYAYVRAYVEEFAELGKYMYEPVKSYSSGMRARLAFALTMAIEFDCYLIDEVMAVGDAKFRSKSRQELFEIRSDRAIISVSHSESEIRKICTKAAVLVGGEMSSCLDVDDAIQLYQSTI